ncbi:hypothetical protein PIB30_093943 [Stylosanthes scabra]|uniref:CCHC-type domain-containing protein n=1 Tax=Stylosanthes scabra TaxID=79078 RepID=A0ABU6UYY6_9FABA|nr:hypothetical protein [Stylosanthes scabra]
MGKEDSEKSFMCRFSALVTASVTMDEIFRVTKSLQQAKHKIESNSKVHEKTGSPSVVIGDLVVIKSKGAPSAREVANKKRLCSACGLAGHTKRTCMGSKSAELHASAHKVDCSQVSEPKVPPVVGNEPGPILSLSQLKIPIGGHQWLLQVWMYLL